MPVINKLQNRGNSGQLTLPKKHLQVSGVLEDGELRDENVLTYMEEPGVWRVESFSGDDLSDAEFKSTVPTISKVQQRNSSFVVTLPKPELQMSGLIEDDDILGVQMLVTMTEPGEWRVEVFNEDAITRTAVTPSQTG